MAEKTKGEFFMNEQVKPGQVGMENLLPDQTQPVVSMKKLLEAGVHFGHQTKRWNPKMKKYIYSSRNGIYIVDLAKAASKIDEAYKALKEIIVNNGKLLIVGTKKTVQDIVKEEALRSGSFYATQRWLGGTLTNYKTIQKRIKYLKDIEKMEQDGTFELLPKKEVSKLKKEAEKLEIVLGGIKEMRKLPNAIFVIDPRVELNAVKEARKLRIPIFGIVDTNSDPDLVDYVIPGNDDAYKSVKLILSLIADAVVEGKGGQTIIAYTKDEGEEVTMTDAIKDADRAEAARRQARQAAQEARRQEFEAREARGEGRGPRRDFRGGRDDRGGYKDRNQQPSQQPVVQKPVSAVETPVETTETKAAKANNAKPVAEKPVEAKPVAPTPKPAPFKASPKPEKQPELLPEEAEVAVEKPKRTRKPKAEAAENTATETTEVVKKPRKTKAKTEEKVGE